MQFPRSITVISYSLTNMKTLDFNPHPSERRCIHFDYSQINEISNLHFLKESKNKIKRNKVCRLARLIPLSLIHI